jgi:hypothetical protein
MKRLSIFLLVFFIYTPVWSGSDYNIEVAKTAKFSPYFRYLNAWSEDGKVQIYGRLSLASMVRASRGHIDVAAYSSSGQLIEETTAEYFPKYISRKSRRRGAKFSAELSQNIPKDAVIKVAFHSEAFKPRPKPTHLATVAK